MSQDRSPQARKTTKKLYTEQPHFDISEYTDTGPVSISPPVLKKLHEDKHEARADIKILKEQLEAERLIIRTMELQNKEFEVNLSSATANIEKLVEDKAQALEEAKHLREQLEDVKSSLHKMDLRNLELEMKLGEANARLHRSNWRTFLQVVITVLGTIIFGIGVNLATSKGNIFLGWGMIAIGAILEIAAFLIGFSPKPER